MKASTIALIICCILSVGYGLYLKYYAAAYKAYTRINQIKKGMTREQVTAALSAPDSVYWDKSQKDSLLVMNYKIGSDTSAAIMQVLFRGDSVRVVKFNK
jgi:hypothetical protein